MALAEDKSDAHYQIQSYLPGRIIINREIYTHSLIISPNQLITKWKPKDIQSLTEADLVEIATLKPEMILLGTGEKSLILPAKTLKPLLEQGFSVECMSTASACRTYTVLISEGRQVAAGLIIESR